VYGFPNPVRNGAKQTIHIEVGIADSIQLRFYDVAGELIKEQRISGLPQAVDDGHGVEYAYETVWSDGIPSGTYLCTVLAHKGNATDLKRTIKLAVIR
jgi:hypothetical protein